MALTLAFDVYGTLIDTHGVVAKLRETLGERATAFSSAWRDKQLEYSFRRGLMQNYENFAVCTRDALDHTCARFGVELTPAQKQALLDVYRELPAFDDAGDALAELSARGCRLYAFSNGSEEAVETLLTAAGIRDRFLGVVSCDDLRSFKPNPAVYAWFLRKAQATGSEAWLVSGNPFDVIGAISAGMRGAWVRRSADAVFDPWGIEPTITVTSLAELADSIGV
ncbi:MAG TPA: haloacid dehalogenase type II [Woeseiaceae bacterium]|nr:haloacid dehalogenase type II [Woeseiaceae bacterium]